MEPETGPFGAYLRGLLKLHDEAIAGRNDGEEADAIRDRMDGPWLAMHPWQRELTNRLSEDLWQRRENVGFFAADLGVNARVHLSSLQLARIVAGLERHFQRPPAEGGE